jgi:hypothetical protein
MKQVMFFYASVSSVNPSVIIFFDYQRIYWRTKNYRWKIHRRSISIGDFVGKLITDGICVLRRRKNSVGKTVKYCSVLCNEKNIIQYYISWFVLKTRPQRKKKKKKKKKLTSLIIHGLEIFGQSYFNGRIISTANAW